MGAIPYTVVLIVVSLAGANLTVILPQPECSIDYFGRTRAPIAGDSIKLQCSSSGWSPPPDLTWLRATEILSIVPQTTNSTIDWTLQATDENLVFTCDAFSEFLSARQSCEVVPFPQPPDVRLIQIGTIAEGSNVTFICDAVGQQPLTYSWTKISVNILSEQRYYTEDSLRILHILDLQEEDNGTVIECEASYVALDMSNIASLDLVLADDIIVPSTEPSLNITGGLVPSPESSLDITGGIVSSTEPSITGSQQVNSPSSLSTEVVIAIVVICIVFTLVVILTLVICTIKRDQKRSLDNVEGTVTHEDAKSTENIAGLADTQSKEGIFNISSELEHDTDDKQKNAGEIKTDDNI